jgi:hypothetical protein
MTDIYMYWVNGLILLGISIFKGLAQVGSASFLPAFARVRKLTISAFRAYKYLIFIFVIAKQICLQEGVGPTIFLQDSTKYVTLIVNFLEYSCFGG